MLREKRSKAFDRWFDRLRNRDVIDAVRMRIFETRFQEGFVGDYKSVGDGVVELSIHKGPGYRLYVTISQGAVLVLLLGGSKSGQNRDIKRAKRILERWEDESAS